MFDSFITPTRPKPPAPFDLRLNDLPKGYAEGIKRELMRPTIDPLLEGYIMGGEIYVSRRQLQELCMPGHCTYDPSDSCCYIADELVLKD